MRRHHAERSLDTEAARSTQARVAERTVTHGPVEADAFERLLALAGLAPGDALPLRASALTPTQAARLLSVLLKKPVTLGNFPSRMGASLLLREVLEGGSVSREELLRRMTRLERLAVLRPDGYLAWVINGRTQQRVGPLEWKDGAFVALGFELGRFYVNTGGVFRPTDEQLQPVFNGFAETFLLDKKGLQHILERHHPRYWDGTTKEAQSFFGAKMSFEDVSRAIEAVLQQNRERMVGRGTRGMYQLRGTVDGVEYVLGLNQGRVGQFYPR
uniref:hypothetical protein n=1 Tax=Corallococcus coralloides TaxID=184914 RepID=UPI000FFEF5A2|nr:hypothetical protein [Corallococcus coralloides]